MIFGQYTLTNMLNGDLRLEWQDQSTKIEHKHIIKNFNNILHEWAGRISQHHIECARLYNLAFTDSNKFCDDPGSVVAEYFHDSGIIPGAIYHGRQLGEYYLEEFVKAYNTKYQISIKWQDLIELTESTLNSFA